MQIREQTAVQWLTRSSPLAVAIVVLAGYLLVAFSIVENRGRPETQTSTTAANTAPDPRREQSDAAFLIRTLKSCGNGADDEALQRALDFVNRCDNRESERHASP